MNHGRISNQTRTSRDVGMVCQVALVPFSCVELRRIVEVCNTIIHIHRIHKTGENLTPIVWWYLYKGNTKYETRENLTPIVWWYSSSSGICFQYLLHYPRSSAHTFQRKHVVYRKEDILMLNFAES